MHYMSINYMQHVLCNTCIVWMILFPIVVLNRVNCGHTMFGLSSYISMLIRQLCKYEYVMSLLCRIMSLLYVLKWNTALLLLTSEIKWINMTVLVHIVHICFVRVVVLFSLCSSGTQSCQTSWTPSWMPYMTPSWNTPFTYYDLP
jgi:hypothetical protein